MPRLYRPIPPPSEFGVRMTDESAPSSPETPVVPLTNITELYRISGPDVRTTVYFHCDQGIFSLLPETSQFSWVYGPTSPPTKPELGFRA